MLLTREPFDKAAEKIGDHEFLQRAAAGDLPMELLARYFGSRLQAGTAFVKYLATLEAQALELAGKDDRYLAVAAAVRKNLDEEEGRHRGEVRRDRQHSTWRAWFRTGIERIFAEERVPISFETPDDFPEVDGYVRTFDSFGEEGDVIASMGGLTLFEYGLGIEYAWIYRALQQPPFKGRFRKREMTYIDSHREHEDRHGNEALAPLIELCDTPDAVARALAGMNRAFDTKKGFLNGALRAPRD